MFTLVSEPLGMKVAACVRYLRASKASSPHPRIRNERLEGWLLRLLDKIGMRESQRIIVLAGNGNRRNAQ
jgi:hypothetical protein